MKSFTRELFHMDYEKFKEELIWLRIQWFVSGVAVAAFTIGLAIQ